MKPFRQLLRQPTRTLMGILLVTLAVAVLCVRLGQSIAAYQAEQNLRNTFQTAIFPSAKYTREADRWTQNYLETHPELVKDMGISGMASAYAQDLTPGRIGTAGDGRHYAAILQITLSDIGPIVPEVEAQVDDFWLKVENPNTTVVLQGIVTDVIALADTFEDPTGYRANISLTVPDAHTLSMLDLEIGAQYLVYCSDYQDLHEQAEASFAQRAGYSDFEGFERERFYQYSETDNRYLYQGFSGEYHVGNDIRGITHEEYDMMWTVFLNVRDESWLNHMEYTLDPEGSVIAFPQEFYTYQDADGEIQCLTWEECRERYSIPTMIRLEGSAADFLNSSEGESWAKAKEEIHIRNHTYAVVGTDHPAYIANFFRQIVTVDQGRFFTEEEVSDAARVCMISQSQAIKHGLGVGDTIRLQYYQNDLAMPGQISVARGEGTPNPVPGYYCSCTTELEPAENYEIVGIYYTQKAVGSTGNDLYSFSDNTIFVPDGAPGSYLENGYAGFFRTFLLWGGTMEQFLMESKDAGFAGQFYVLDNGYSDVAASLAGYQANRERICGLGIGIYLVLLVLFLVMYPCQQSRQLVIMERLGVSLFRKRLYLLQYAMGILVPGTVLGASLGFALWEQVQRLAMPVAENGLFSPTKGYLILAVSLGQLLLAAGFVALLSVYLGRNQGLSLRK